MRTYKLLNQHRVQVRALGDGAYDFETRNPNGETISTVTLQGDAAAETLGALRINDAIRFGQTYGAGR
ncbi:hypothetical protein PV729_04395 [Streptomyces europaeiscabiei]|uniref:Uncharacterized protein n=1 Tax=Streptomyces europaeiscabiei TaxID=146819 RepID=A0ABU4N734_9ACTN|nr:hypothetical protein [Streptomyces europaeiscabiei]MDX3551018.1 hypothetical protein [Streptomyces europaeiscabiei]MDX3698422.1 hypothetical protein [Streptomyces europaeiscabiei]